LGAVSYGIIWAIPAVPESSWFYLKQKATAGTYCIPYENM
jgi:hypothetical protein